MNFVDISKDKIHFTTIVFQLFDCRISGWLVDCGGGVFGIITCSPPHPHHPRILTMERKITFKTSCNFEYNRRKQVHHGLMDTIVFVDNGSNNSATQCNSINQSIVTIIVISRGIKYYFY